MPSEEDPTQYYHWRGKEMGEEIIQLGSDNFTYKMKFLHGGKRVKGTWGTHDSDPGNVQFGGVQTSESDGSPGFRIRYAWKDYNEAAYNKANRERWH